MTLTVVFQLIILNLGISVLVLRLWVDGTDAIGERLRTTAAEIFGEKRKPCGEKLRNGSEFGR
jgi:hypothetical protein